MSRAMKIQNSGGAKIDTTKIKTATKITRGYTHGQDHTQAINGTLISITFGNNGNYSFINGVATMLNGATQTITTSTRWLEGVASISFAIASNNSDNGTGIAGITYLEG